MSLTIEVGQLARCVALKDRRAVREIKRDLKKINEVLKGQKLPVHLEPEDLNGKQSWHCRIAGHPYLGPLKRLAAYVRQEVIREDYAETVGLTEWPAAWAEDWEAASNDPVFRHYYTDASELFDHLMYHSESKGYYVPIDFSCPLHPRGDSFEELGGQIGSTQGLLSNCVEVARVIGLPDDLEPDSKCFRDATESADELGDGWWRYENECRICLSLIQACRQSLELEAVIVFSG